MAGAGKDDDLDVERMRDGVRRRVAGLAGRAGAGVERHSASALTALLCAGAVAPIVATAGSAEAVTLATAGVVGAIGAEHLADVATRALEKLRGPSPDDRATLDLERVEEAIEAQVERVLDAGGEAAEGLRAEIAALLRAIDAEDAAVAAALERHEVALALEIAAAVGLLSAQQAQMASLQRQALAVLDVIREHQVRSGAAGQQSLADLQALAAQFRSAYEGLRGQLTDRVMAGDGDGEGQDAAAGAPRWPPDVSPYPGLTPFTYAERALFFGRHGVTAELLVTLRERIDGPAVVVVTGASGAGKSSLVQAGLRPALERGRLGVPGSEAWPHLLVTPNARPLDELARALAGGERDAVAVRDRLAADPADAPLLVRAHLDRGGADRAVLVVDQFEQLFAADRGQAASFVAALWSAATTPIGAAGTPPAVVVLVVRGDHIDRCAAYPELVDALQHGQFVVGPMDEAELRQAVCGPAEAAGLDLEAGLVECVLADLRPAASGPPTAAGADVAALPLLSQAMAATWEQRDGRRLTVAAYEAGGGVHHAIARSAEAAFLALSPAGQRAARHLFLRLTRLGARAAPARRSLAVAEVEAELAAGAAGTEAPGLAAVIEAFVARRLLVRDGATVEIGHDALYAAWPRLGEWLEADRAELVGHAALAARADAWEAAGRDPAYLDRGAELAAAIALAERWAAAGGRYPPIGPVTAAFVAAGRGAEARQRRRARRGRAALAAAVAVAMVLVSLVAYQRRVAGREEASDASRALAAASVDVAGTDPALAGLLALAGAERADTPEAQRAMFRSYLDALDADRVVSGAPGTITDVAASRDGGVLAARAQGGTVTVWRRVDGRLRTRQLPGVQAWDVDLSLDGRTIVLYEAHRARALDLATGREVWSLPLDTDEEYAARWRDDGLLALRLYDEGAEELQLWRRTGAQLELVGRTPVEPERYTGLVGLGPAAGGTAGAGAAEAGTDSAEAGTDSVYVSDDAPGEEGLRLVEWDARTGKLAVIAEGLRGDVDTSPDGTTAVACRDAGGASDGDGDGEALVILDPATKAERVVDASCAGDRAIDAAGEVVASEGQSVDLRSGEATGLAQPKAVTLWGVVAVTRDERGHAAVYADENDLRFVRIEGSERPVVDVTETFLLPGGDAVLSLGADRDELVVSTTGAGARVTARASIPQADGLPAQVATHDVALDRDGTLVAVRVANDRVQVRRLPGLELVADLTTRPVRGITAGTDDTRDLAFLGRDTLMASDAAWAQFLDIGTGDEVRTIDLEAAGLVDPVDADDVAFSPYSEPGRVAVVARGQAHMRVLDIESGRTVERVAVGRDAVTAAFSPGSPHFAVLRAGSRVELWGPEGRERALTTLSGDAQVERRFVARWLTDGSFLLGDENRLAWYEPDGRSTGRSLPLGEGRMPTSTSADGATVMVTAYTEQGLEGRVVSTRPDDWRRAICRVLAGRELTDDERADLPARAPAGDVC